WAEWTLLMPGGCDAGTASAAYAGMNERGEVVGRVDGRGGSPASRPCLWHRGGRPEWLPIPAGLDRAAACAITADGRRVAGCGTSRRDLALIVWGRSDAGWGAAVLPRGPSVLPL